MKTLDEQVAALRRELALRLRVYPKWIASGKMTQHKAEHEIDCIRDAITTLETFRAVVPVPVPVPKKPDLYETQMDLAITALKKLGGVA